MRVRQNAAIFGTIIILFGCITLYLMTDLTFPQKRTSLLQEYQDNKWLHFEDRLKRLENDLSKHNVAVGEIKSAIQQLKPPLESSVNNDPTATALFVNTVTPAALISKMKYANECPIQVAYTPKINIQMLELYKEMKFDNPDGGVWKQGFKINYAKEQWSKYRKLKVFVVPHSHNDPGWIKTFVNYFETQTRKIFNNMIEKLEVDERRKFIWAEISFLALWWAEIDTEKKRTLKRLVQSGQLEIVTGGWVMNDEANTHWGNMVQQLTEGHQWLALHLNVTPHNAWTIDPFGMSPTMAYILHESGFDNLVIQRVHYAVKKQLARNKQLEFKWRQLWDGSGTTDLFTHMMPFYSYDVPHTCGPNPKVCCQFDFRRLPGSGVACPWQHAPQVITDNNVESRANLLLDQYRQKAQLYETNVVLAPLGDDFRYDRDSEWDAQYGNYQKLMDYMNSNEGLNVQIQFGTLKDFFNAVREEKQVEEFPSLSGDFFTYADRDDHYWSGYYTSRPFYKRMDRILMSYLRAAEILVTLAGNSRLLHSDWIFSDNSDISHLLSKSRQSLSLFQHHDGVTGTARNFVVVDYGQQMLSAINYTQHIIQQAANVLLTKSVTTPHSESIFYDLDDVRATHDALPKKSLINLNDKFPSKRVVLYNSLTSSRSEVVTLHISTPYVTVTDSQGSYVKCQISPVFKNGVILSASLYEVAFMATVPAFALVTYTISTAHQIALPPETEFSQIKIYNSIAHIELPDGFPNIETSTIGAVFSIRNSRLKAAFNNYGLLKAIRIGETTIPVHLEFMKYGVRKSNEMSGAYLFLPDGDAQPTKISNEPIRVCEGSIFSSVNVQLPYVDHTVYLFETKGADSLGVEIRNIVDISETNNFELIMRLSTNIHNGDEFFTDLNGLQMIRRKRFAKLPLQANYYPIPNMAYIEDNEMRLTIVTAGALGIASLREGQIEIMQDRRLLQDDNRGLGQGVLDNHPTQHVFRLLLQTRKRDTCKTTAENYPAGYPTLSAHVASQSLLYPIYRLISIENSEHKTTFAPVTTESGVDIHLGVLRSSVFIQNSLDNIGVVIHRQNLDVCFENPTIFEEFPMSTGKVNFSSILPVGSIGSKFELYESPLTFTKIGNKIDIRGYHSICPMELKSFVLHR